MRGWNAGWDQISTSSHWRYYINSCWMLVGVVSLAPSSARDCQFLLPNGQLTVARFDSNVDMEDCLEFVE